MSAAEPAQSVAALYITHHRWLEAWLRKRLGNASDASDLAHDAFLKLLARKEAMVLQEPRAYLTTVARSLVSNLYRRRRVEVAYLQALADLPEPVFPGPETTAMVLETLIEIDCRLDGLPPLVRRAFLMSQLDGMKQSAIAAELGISLATVQRHIVKAVHQCFFARAM